MGVFGGGGGGTPAAVPPVKASPPPAQMSASLQAVRNARGMTGDAGDLGGTILTGGGGVEMPGAMVPRSPADLLYGKKLTGA